MRRTFGQKILSIGILFSSLWFAGCSAQGIFYYPDAHLYLDPETLDLKYEIVQFPSLNGAKLTGLYFSTKEHRRGVAVHLHGNSGNVSNHFPGSVFLLRYGFDVLVLDYQGFGASEGKPSPKRTMEDGIAAVRYAQSRAGDKGVVVFGQSIGAAVACVVAAQEPLVRAVVMEASFTRYRSITREVLKRSLVTWPLAFTFPPLAVRRGYDPIDYVDKISPKPLLIVHGTADKTIPLWMSEQLYRKAKEPKALYVVQNGEHLGYRRQEGPRYENKIADFFTRALEKSKRKD